MSSSRKSTRLTAKAEAATQLLQKDKHPGTTTKKVQGSRNPKKQRTSKDALIAGQRIKAKEENSKLLKDIPFDVLLEIFRLLEPADLLHFSRVSKSLHGLLISDDLSSVWKSAYMNVDQVIRPPLCPDDTNVVFYTNFIYGRHCQFCSPGHGRTIYHDSAFIRLCSKCADDSLLELSKNLKGLCNSWPLQYKDGKEMILKVEYRLRLEEIDQARKKNAEFSYLNQRNRILHDHFTVAFRISDWRRKMYRIRLANLREKRNLREAAILKKLEQEKGYDQADILAIKYQVQHAPHARKSHDLTDSEWRLIRADVLDFLQDIRESWVMRRIKDTLQDRISQLEWFIFPWKLHPTAWWLVSSEPIASFVQIGSSKETYTISSADFEEIEPQIHDLITSWKEETDCYLATLIPQPSGKGKQKDPNNSKTNPLELATTFFKCYWCTEPVGYPRILMHGCFRKTVKSQDEARDEEGDESDMEDQEEDADTDACGPREPRPPKKITPGLILPMLSGYYSLGMRAGVEGVTYDEEASNTARDIIMACGEDPKTVTSATMEEKPVRLECLRCSRAMQAKQKTKSNRLVMKWNMAVVHELEEHYGEPPSSEPAWRKVDPSDQEKVENAETNMRNLKRYQKLLTCNHCRWLNTLPEFKVQHIVNTHDITVNKDTVSDHFSPPVDTSVKLLYPAVKI